MNAAAGLRRAATRARSGASAGFTLLEVLVAVAILGLSVTAVISAQFTPVKEANHARYIALSTGLARCKMSEIETTLAKDGFSDSDEHDSGACCETQEGNDIACEWFVAKPVLPDPALGKLDLGAELDLGPVGALSKAASGQGPGLPPDAGIHDMAQLLGGGGDDPAAAAASAGASIASLLMSMVYPDLKLLLEASVRRVTVKLTWAEPGGASYSFEVVQWVANPAQAGAIAAAAAEAAAAESGLGTGSGSGSGSGSGAGGKGKSDAGAKR